MRFPRPPGARPQPPAKPWTRWLPLLLPVVILGTLLALRDSIESIIAERSLAAAGLAKLAAAPSPVCRNTCFKANNGVCDEGRPPTLAPKAADPAAAPAAANATAAKPARLRHLLGLTSPGSSGGSDSESDRTGAWGWLWRLAHGALGLGGVPGSGAGGAGAGGWGRRLQAVEGHPAVSELLCDLGTDCADCGPWNGTVPTGWEPHDGPVAWLRAEHNASLFVRTTDTPRPFLAAITHHQADPDVSAMLWHYGAMEGGVTRVLHWMLEGQCEPPKGRRRTVLDVGANFGYYTIQSALYGCNVVAFEPVRKFRAPLDWAVHAAGVAERVTLVGAALGEAAGEARLALPKDGTYWGLASLDGINLFPQEIVANLTVNVTTLDRWAEWAPKGFKPKDALLLKMDLEGWEPRVIQGGKAFLKEGCEGVLMEYSPGVLERIFERPGQKTPQGLAALQAFPASLLALQEAGFTAMAHLPLFAFAAPWPPKKIVGSEPLPPFESVTPAMARHDLEALEYRGRMELDPGGCPLPTELTTAFPVWRRCSEWTYATHPKGLRSAFGFNTNLWALRERAGARRHMVLQGSAALFEEAQDMKVWTSLRRNNTGFGLTDCGGVGLGHKQLFRCPCPAEARAQADSECAKQEALVERLAREGKMPFTDSKR
ncbi:hypothetical protein HYH03_016024 [Edaphochlamys debaryana]|uniref:Methyltransferase FkbM domain-containing protein n=1 Tax=Edaphochlamys debaryana TaxID=47281 RepID=A0A835XJH8_9CHLO|nr:hypothetical protein HYH03_016024 [Edaphochlamys debaryana]|eukprot:KAG2485238.1 hypothetical protein HYH03_016024 [Edaphochlamys debaryana]